MKLLLDQNLSFKLVSALADVFPGAAHVRDVSLTQSDDHTIWAYANKNGFMVGLTRRRLRGNGGAAWRAAKGIVAASLWKPAHQQ
jgi:hypothetical protein